MLETLQAVEEKKYWGVHSVLKRRGLGLQLDAMGWIIVILIIAACVVGSVVYLRDSARVATTKMELDQIRSAALAYQGLRLDASYPDSITILLEDDAIPASDSIDGMKHGNFLPTTNRWTSSGVLDYWGNEYVIDVANEIIYSTHGSNDQDERISVSF